MSNEELSREAADDFCKSHSEVTTQWAKRGLEQAFLSAIEKAREPLVTAIKTAINENDMMPLFMVLDEPAAQPQRSELTLEEYRLKYGCYPQQPPATDEIKQGHSALRVRDGKLEKFDPHPAPRGEQEWTLEDHSDEKGGIFLCAGTSKIWFSSSSLESLEKTVAAHNAALAAARLEETAHCRAISHDEICRLQDALAAEREKVSELQGCIEVMTTEFTAHEKTHQQLLAAQAAMQEINDWVLWIKEPDLSDEDKRAAKVAGIIDDVTNGFSALQAHDQAVRQKALGDLKTHDAIVRKPLVEALKILLESAGCLAGEEAEIPEEISAQFDISLDDAQKVHDALAKATK